MASSQILSQLLGLLFVNGCMALKHRILITNITSAVEHNFGNISFTLDNSKLSFYFYNKHIIDNAIMTTELNVKTADAGTYTNFFIKRINLCEFLANPNIDPLIYIGYKVLIQDKRNHIISKCPIKAVNKITIGLGLVHIYLTNLILYKCDTSIGLLFRQRFFHGSYWRSVTSTQPEFYISLRDDWAEYKSIITRAYWR